jgi:hypothetical protein
MLFSMVALEYSRIMGLTLKCHKFIILRLKIYRGSTLKCK